MPASGALSSSNRTKPVRNQIRAPTRLTTAHVRLDSSGPLGSASEPRGAVDVEPLVGLGEWHARSIGIEDGKADQRRNQREGQQAASTPANQQEPCGNRPGVDAEGAILLVSTIAAALLECAIIAASLAEPIEDPPRPVADSTRDRCSSHRCHRRDLQLRAAGARQARRHGSGDSRVMAMRRTPHKCCTRLRMPP